MEKLKASAFLTIFLSCSPGGTERAVEGEGNDLFFESSLSGHHSPDRSFSSAPGDSVIIPDADQDLDDDGWAPLCDRRGDAPRKASKAERAETHARVGAVCERLKASPIVCAYMDAIVERESHGLAGVRHTYGKGEDGLGPMGLSLKAHGDKWPGSDEDPMFCSPEVSAVVAHAIFWRAVTRYRAESISDIQSIYGGFWDCGGSGDERSCFPSRDYPPGSNLFKRLDRRGFSIYDLISGEDLGTRLSLAERRAFAMESKAAFDKKALDQKSR